MRGGKGEGGGRGMGKGEEREGEVEVMGAVILSGRRGLGLF